MAAAPKGYSLCGHVDCVGQFPGLAGADVDRGAVDGADLCAVAGAVGGAGVGEELDGG